MYQLAAAQGNIDAQYGLGVKYTYGQGGPLNKAQQLVNGWKKGNLLD